jgi:hypothetical protein
MEVITSQLLVNGLRTEFWDTYEKVKNRLPSQRLGDVMDLSITATNREHDFGYIEAPPHPEQWKRGQGIPEDAMDSTKFTTYAYNWGRRIKWNEDDRMDEQTQSLFPIARLTGQSFALLPLRFFFDMISNGDVGILPDVPNAPDGAAMFYATDGDSNDRFGVSGGNLISGGGVTTTALIQTDYYAAVRRFREFQDGKGQPLFNDDIIDSGTIIIHPPELTEIMEKAFLQRRQAYDVGSNAGTTPSNIIYDASRDVTLWASAYLTDANDWYVFLKGSPIKPTFFMERAPVRELTSLMDDNNSDSVRTTKEEYIQWDSRSGAGIALPYGAVKVENS